MIGAVPKAMQAFGSLAIAKKLPRGSGRKRSRSCQVLITFVSILGTAHAADNQKLPSGIASRSGTPVHGVVRPSERATISTDLAARVIKIGFKEGQRFKNGDLLVAFDCERPKAELAAAEAQFREFKVGLDGATVLEKRSSGSRQDIEVARARADKAAAEADAIRARTRQCNIFAPYDGVVISVMIHEHELQAAGNPLLSIVGSGEPEIELVVPSTWLSWLVAGARFDFYVEETKKGYRASVQRLAGAADTVSQTLKIYAKFDEPAPNVLPGSSGIATFETNGIGQ